MADTKKHTKTRIEAPAFAHEAEEALYWEQHLRDLHPSTLRAVRGSAGLEEILNKPRLTSIRLAPVLLNRLKFIARKIDVPYQAYVKTALLKQLAADEKTLRV